MLDKPRRNQNPEFRKWIRSLPSVVSGRGPCEVVHVRSRGAGGGDEGNIVPLTQHEHIYQLHQWGQKTFEARWCVDLGAVALELWERWQRGREVLSGSDDP